MANCIMFSTRTPRKNCWIFQDTFSGCIDSLIETLEELRDAVCGIDVPNIEPFPEPDPMPLPEEPEQYGELPF